MSTDHTAFRALRDTTASLAGRPPAWLGVAIVGFALICIGLVIEAWREDRGADAATVVSFSNPGMLIALVGLCLVAIGIFATGALVALGRQPSSGRWGAALLGGAIAVLSALAFVAAIDVTRDHDGGGATTSMPVGVAGVPGSDARATLRGTLTLDGAPLNAEFLGARVFRDGLPGACQGNIPAVSGGVYEIKVVADAEVSGCGAEGATVMLWAFTNGGYVFSNELADWPGDGSAATFDATFSSSAPKGASTPVTEFKGEMRDRDGVNLPGGTVLEAFVGDVRCGRTSMRYGNTTEDLYTLVVAGPESISGCAEGATLTFRLNGEPAAETAVNDLGAGREGDTLNLTIK